MKTTYFIGISGTSASGKSTFSDKLRNRLSDYKVKIIHMDEYYKEEQERPRIIGVMDGKEYIDDNHPMSIDLDKCYMDVKNGIAEEWDVLVVEGIFALWDQRILDLLDLKIFVDCDSDERMLRRLSRNLSFGQTFEEITGRYIQAVQPRQREYVEPAKWKADIIINGFGQASLGIDIVVNWVRNKLAYISEEK